RSTELPKVHSSALPSRNLRRDADAIRQKWEIVVIDGGARVTEHAYAAVGAANWLIIPVRPSKVDLDATAQFLDIVQADMAKRDDLSGGLLLNQFQEGTSISNVAKKQILEWDFPVFSNMLHSYVAFSEAIWQGQSVVEYQPKSKAAVDICKFFEELKEATQW
ncbi:MAG: hypothetical protein ACRD63_09925, partial [Pyrinomonadaceae bacterium]